MPKKSDSPAAEPAYTVTVREDLHETRRYDEDGEPIVRSTFCLVATDARGARWASPHVHDSYPSARSERRHLARGFDPTRPDSGWYEVEPMYGSAAWTPEVEARLAYQERESEGWGRTARW